MHPINTAPSNVTHQKHLPLMHPTHQECNCKGKNVTFSVSTLSPVHYLSVPVDVYCLPCLCILSPLSMSIISLSVYNISPVYVYSLPCSCILFPCSCPWKLSPGPVHAYHDSVHVHVCMPYIICHSFYIISLPCPWKLSLCPCVIYLNFQKPPYQNSTQHICQCGICKCTW